MTPEEARSAIESADALDAAARADRLIWISGEFPDEVAVHGTAAQLLLDDVKATWIYGFFASTVVSAHAFCLLQLTRTIRLHTDELSVNERFVSLTYLAELAHGNGLISGESRVLLIRLEDRRLDYVDSQSDQYEDRLETHLREAQQFDNAPPLYSDGQLAVAACASILE